MLDPELDGGRMSARSVPEPVSSPGSGPTKNRQKIVVRKRRRSEKVQRPRWAARRSLRRSLQLGAVCVVALLLLIAGLLFGLGA